MNTFMQVILSRVLSEEIAQQELWQREDEKNFGKDMSDRSSYVAEIKQFMKDNGIEFKEHFYLEKLMRG